MVPKGSVVAVIGPNGSGKSTLFNVITGLVPAEEGSIRFHGEEIMGLPDYQILEKGIARTFQNLRLFANLTVMENALIGQHARLKTGTVAAILRPPGTQAEERQAREWAMEIFSIFGNRLTPRVGQVVAGPVLRQSPPHRDRPRAGLAAAHPAAGRADRRDESGRDAGTGGADQEPERAGTDGAADRAQAGCRHHAGRHGLSCSTTAR